MLADGPHIPEGEVEEVEEARAATGRNRLMGQGCRCSCSGRAESEREAGGTWRVCGEE